MHIAYVVNNISHVAGGTRVILAHLNGLAARGYKAELWLRDTASVPYFECNVPIVAYSPARLTFPDAVVLTDQVFYSGRCTLPQRQKNFFITATRRQLGSTGQRPARAHFYR